MVLQNQIEITHNPQMRDDLPLERMAIDVMGGQGDKGNWKSKDEQPVLGTSRSPLNGGGLKLYRA